MPKFYFDSQEDQDLTYDAIVRDDDSRTVILPWLETVQAPERPRAEWAHD